MNNLLEHKGHMGTVEYSADDNILFGKVVGIRSLISYEGDSLQTLQSDFVDGIEHYLSCCANENVEPEKPYNGNIDIRISPALYKQLHVFQQE